MFKHTMFVWAIALLLGLLFADVVHGGAKAPTPQTPVNITRRATPQPGVAPIGVAYVVKPSGGRVR